MISRDLLLPILLLGNLSAHQQGDDGEQFDINVENEINGHGDLRRLSCSGSLGDFSTGRATNSDCRGYFSDRNLNVKHPDAVMLEFA